MSRDFTYVDDVVAGILSALDYTVSVCSQVFNIGSGRPVSIINMIRIVEKELNTTAKIVRNAELPNYLRFSINSLFYSTLVNMSYLHNNSRNFKYSKSIGFVLAR